MVSVCLPSYALLQHQPSYLGFSYTGCGVSLHGCSSKALLMLLTLDEGYLLTSTIKRNAFESVLMRWMNPERIMQSEISQKEKDKYRIYTESGKLYWRVYLQGSSGEIDIENRLMDMGRGVERVSCMERVTWKLILAYVK